MRAQGAMNKEKEREEERGEPEGWGVGMGGDREGRGEVNGLFFFSCQQIIAGHNWEQRAECVLRAAKLRGRRKERAAAF